MLQLRIPSFWSILIKDPFHPIKFSMFHFDNGPADLHRNHIVQSLSVIPSCILENFVKTKLLHKLS